MQRAFIVHLDIEETDFLAGIAEDIKDSLETDGHIVISVTPYAAREASTDPEIAQSAPALEGTIAAPLAGSLF